MSRIIDENIQASIANGDYIIVDNQTTGTHRIDAKNLMDTKVDKVTGKELSENDFTTTLKNKLDGIASGAEVNQNAFSNVKVGSTTIVADGKTDTLELAAGTNITLTPDDSGDKVTISAATYTPASATPVMDGTGAVGSSVKYAREDHVHPSDTSKISTSQKGVANGVAELDENGIILSSQLPSYVDDVLEYSSQFDFPVTGESGKIYIATDTNLTYRWSGTGYVMVASSLALGETFATAYRGDRGKTAYDHATEAGRLTTAQTSGLYKFSTTAEGHIAGVTAVVKSDITGLGIPGQDTTYESKSAASGGTAVSLVTTGEKYNWNTSSNIVNTTVEDGDYVISQVSGTKTLAPYANSTYIMMPDIATTDSVDETLYGLLEDMEWEDYVVQDSIIPVTVNQTIGAIVQEGLAEKINTETTRADLDTTAATGTTDGDLYAAITALSWQSDVVD